MSVLSLMVVSVFAAESQEDYPLDPAATKQRRLTLEEADELVRFGGTFTSEEFVEIARTGIFDAKPKPSLLEKLEKAVTHPIFIFLSGVVLGILCITTIRCVNGQIKRDALRFEEQTQKKSGTKQFERKMALSTILKSKEEDILNLGRTWSEEDPQTWVTETTRELARLVNSGRIDFTEEEAQESMFEQLKWM